MQSPAAAENVNGTRCSLFYNGEFYDNVFIRIRGGTSISWPKKSYKIEFNDDHQFLLHRGVPRVDEINLDATYTDKSYVRAALTSEFQLDAGTPSPETYHVRVHRNNQFFSVAFVVEQPDLDFLRRHGLDPEGALYTGGPGSTYTSSGSFEKKNRDDEDKSDVNALVQGLLPGRASAAVLCRGRGRVRPLVQRERQHAVAGAAPALPPLLDEQSRLERMAKIIGKDALPARQQLTLACADLVNAAFLRQSAFAPKDRVAGPAKQAAMMRLVGRFIELATQAVAAGVAPDRLSRLACLRPLARMGEEIADDEPEKFDAVASALETEFHDLIPAPEARDETPAAG